MLDNSCLLFTSSMWSGSQARRQQGPGRIGRRPGRHAADGPRSRLCRQGDDNRKLCSMYLSIMDRMGVSSTASVTPTAAGGFLTAEIHWSDSSVFLGGVFVISARSK